MRSHSIYNIGIEHVDKPAVMSTCIARMIPSHGVYDSSVDTSTSQFETDASVQSTDLCNGPRQPEMYETSEDVESQYLSLANNEEAIKLYDVSSDKESTNTVEKNSKIIIVDMTGSAGIKKLQADGERLKEAQHMNLSLLELANFISDLADNKKKHIPYRNSVLTRLLQDSLGGNNKLTFLLCVSTTMLDTADKKYTLDFGQDIKNVFATPSINIGRYKWKYKNGIVDQGLMKEPTKEIKKRKKSRKRTKSEQIEYTNVVTEFDQSKTLIEKLQYMMGLKKEDAEDKAELDVISNDGDRTEADTETDDSLTEGSDVECSLQEADKSNHPYNGVPCDISAETSLIGGTTNNIGESTIDVDLPENPAIEVDEPTETAEDVPSSKITYKNTGDSISYDICIYTHNASNAAYVHKDVENSKEHDDLITNEKACIVDETSLQIMDSMNGGHTTKYCTNQKTQLQGESTYFTGVTDVIAKEVSNTSTEHSANGAETVLYDTAVNINNTNDEITDSVKGKPKLSKSLLVSRLNNIRDQLDHSRYLHHVRFGCWCERVNKHS